MDIRLDTKFFGHPKTMKLLRRLGPDGVLSLLRLWCWAAENRPTGVLHGLDGEAVDLIAAGSTDQADQTDQASFFQVAKGLGWIDLGEDGVLRLHEWAQYNPWAADAPNRSDKARFSKLASVAPEVYYKFVQEGRNSITAEEYRTALRQRADNAPTTKHVDRPAPNPSPSPAPGTDNDPMRTLLKVYRGFPGYRAELEYKERAWLQTLIERFQELDIVEELGKARRWIELKQDFQIKNSRGYITKWLERVQKERS